MGTMRKIWTGVAAAAVLAAAGGLLAQEAGARRDTAPKSGRGMPMMEHGHMPQDTGMRGMRQMMGMMAECMEMMESMGMDMGEMSMMGSMREGPEAVLRHRDELTLSDEQVRELELAREELEQARRQAMERMREAHDAMRQAAAEARDRSREALTPEQRARLSELAGPGMEGCPMHRPSDDARGSDEAGTGGRDA